MSDSKAPDDGARWSWQVVRWVLTFIAIPLLLWWKLSDDAFWNKVGQDMEVRTLISTGAPDLAIEVATRHIAERPTAASLYTARGEAYRRKGDTGHALADFNTAIHYDAEDDDAYLQRCLVFHAMGQTERAIADCEVAARNPSNWPAQEAIASMQLESGDFDRAYDSLGALITRQQPPEGVPGPRFHRGRLALFLYDRPNEAADDLAKASDDALQRFRLSIEGSLPAIDGANRIVLPFTFFPDGIHLLIWNHVARLRAGQDGGKEFADHLDKVLAPIRAKLEQSIPQGTKFEGDLDAETARRAFAPWPGAMLALFAGKATPDALRAMADGEADPALRRQKSCETDFYLAEYALTKGEREDASRLLHAAAEECPEPAEEARLAKWELKRIQP
jgi:tetratricopeptide (TPR) repeat protein